MSADSASPGRFSFSGLLGLSDNSHQGTELKGTAPLPCSCLFTLFLTLFFAYVYIHQRDFNGLIPVSRLDLLHAITIHKSLKIDPYHENTPDKSIYAGHYFSDKAPACALLALPAFLMAAGCLSVCGVPLDSDLGWLVSSWLACAGSLAIITAMGGVAMFVWLRQWVQPRHAYIATLGVFLGASPFPYCTLMMSHSITVGLLAIALWAGDFGKRSSTCKLRLGFSRDVLAGLCCGLTLAGEYSAGIAVVGILLAFSVDNLRRIVPLALGLVGPLMIVPAYHWLCFGNPFTFAYHHEVIFTQMHEGFFGIKWPPRADKAFALLLSTRQGLFFWSPFFLMAFVGYSAIVVKSRIAFYITYCVPLLQVLIISGYFYPEAGGTFGPRLLAPVLVLLALPVAHGLTRFPRIGSFLVGISILTTMLATVTDIVFPEVPGNPLFEYHLVEFINGNLSYNLGTVIGLPSHFSLVPLVLALGFGIWMTWRQLPESSPGESGIRLQTNK